MTTTRHNRTERLTRMEGTGTARRAILSGLLVAALVAASFPAQALAAAGQTAQATASAGDAYAPDFSPSDVALPEGIVATADGLKVTDAASPAVRDAAASTSAANWKNAGATVDYTVEALGYVDRDAQKVGEFGKSMFNIIKSGSTGDVKGVISSVKAFLTISGAIKGKSAGPSNAELMSEVKELNNLV